MKSRRPLSLIIATLSLAALAGACGGKAHTHSTSAVAARSPAQAPTTPSPTARAPVHINASSEPASCDKGAATAVTVRLPSGSRRLGPGVLAMVGSEAITASECQAQLTRTLAATRIPVGKPPDYSACVSALRAQRATELKALAKAPKGTVKPPAEPLATLRSECAARLPSMVSSVLDQLIQYAWITQQAAAEHITVSNAQVNAALAAQRKAFRTPKLYSQYLARAGLSQAQLAQQERIELLQQRINQQRLGPPAKVTDQQVAAFFNAHRAEFVLPHQPHPKLSTYAARIRLLLAEQASSKNAVAASQAYESHWKSRTACRPGYVVALCANASTG